jgi:FAD/FMN-containing dehydrogenase
MPLVETDDVLVSLDRLTGIVAHDREGLRATARAGTRLGDLTAELLKLGMSMENLGDVDYQSIAGAVATGTHGSGVAWGSIASTAVGLRLIDGRGDVVECSEGDDSETMNAARVSLGLLGVFTAITIRCLPALKMYERRWCVSVDECLAQLADLMQEHQHFDFYWYPRRDEVGIRARGFMADGAEDAFPPPARVGWIGQILPHDRRLKFNEMEYAVPRAAGPECFLAVRKRMRERHIQQVAWRVLYRTVAAEDSYLSPSFGRDSVTISVHQNAHLPFAEFFADIEPIFRSFDGRPHWAKRHALGQQELSALYPMWERFSGIRQRFDPDGRFLNDYLATLHVTKEVRL